MSNATLLLDATIRYLRAPVAWSGDATSMTFDPPLSVSEQATLDQIRTAIAFGLGGVDPATLARLWPQIVACGTFSNDPTPTNAEAIAALKALILIVRDMLVAGTAT